MSRADTFPFEGLLAQLSQAMSAPGSPVAHERGTQASASYTADERIVWLMGPPGTGIETVVRPFQLPDTVTPCDQAWDHSVEIHGPTELRVGELHRLLVGALDTLVGPEQGAAPSDDYAPAELTGTVDLRAWLWPSLALSGLSLAFVAPYAVTVDMPAESLASPTAAAVAIRDALRTIGSPVLVGLARGDDGERFLRLSIPADPLGTVAPTITLDPDAADSACAVLGLDGTPAIGAAPTMPYRPGYRVGKSEPGPRGGTVEAGAWGLVVPVRLYLPIRSLSYVPAIIQQTAFTVAAATDTGEDIAITNPAS